MQCFAPAPRWRRRGHFAALRRAELRPGRCSLALLARPCVKLNGRRPLQASRDECFVLYSAAMRCQSGFFSWGITIATELPNYVATVQLYERPTFLTTSRRRRSGT